MSVKSLDSVQLLEQYNEILELLTIARKKQAVLKEELKRRVDENGGSLIIGNSVAEINEYETVRTRPIGDMTEELGEEFVKDNWPVLTKVIINRKLKIGPKV